MYLLILVVSNNSANVENYNVFVNIFVETIIAFEETSYTFSEDVGVGTVCLERSGYIQGTNDVKVSGGTHEWNKKTFPIYTMH